MIGAIASAAGGSLINKGLNFGLQQANNEIMHQNALEMQGNALEHASNMQNNQFQHNNAFQAQGHSNAMELQKDKMSNTIQRQVADMKAAGVNPALAGGFKSQASGGSGAGSSGGTKTASSAGQAEKRTKKTTPPVKVNIVNK